MAEYRGGRPTSRGQYARLLHRIVMRSAPWLRDWLRGLLGSEHGALALPPGQSPFTVSPFWPPLSDTGRPKPLLSLCLALLSFFMYRVFYGRNSSRLYLRLHERKRAMRAAQATSVLIGQQERFHLGKLHGAALREKDPSRPTIFHGVDNLMVKSSVRAPLTLDLNEFIAEKASMPASHGAIAGEAGSFETSLRSRTLKMVQCRGGSLTPVSSTHEVEEVFQALTDEDYPVTFVFQNVPATSSDLYNLVVDRAYSQRVSQRAQYTEKERLRFQALESLLHKVAAKQLEETIKKTQQARRLEGAEPVLPEDVKTLPPYHNAQKLTREVEFFEGDRNVHGALEIFPGLVPRPLILQAKAVLRLVRRSRRAQFRLVWGIVAPCLPYWVVGTVIHSWLECVVAQLFRENFSSRLFKLIEGKRIGQRTARVYITQWAAGWFMLKVWGWFSANLLFNKASHTFNCIGITHVCEAVMRQDMEYFDHHSAIGIYNQTQSDLEAVGRYLLWTSKEIITEGTAIVANIFSVYRMAPASMFFFSVAPLPFITLGQMLMVRREHRWQMQAHFMREHAGMDMAEVFKEIRTVRDFSAEQAELARINQIKELMIDIELGRQSKTDIVMHMFDMLSKLGEAVTILIACQCVADGRLSPADGIVVMTTLSSMVGAKIKGMIDRCKNLSELAIPLGRLQEILSRQSEIEPAKANHLVTLRAPSQLESVLAALSRHGVVERPLEVRSVEGQTIGRGLRLVSVGPAEEEQQDCVQLLEARRPVTWPLQLEFSRGIAPLQLAGSLEFVHVEFRYPTELRVPALRDISFELELGVSAAFVGPTGCGKTTITKLVRRLYDPIQGHILLNKVPLHEYDIRRLRRKIAVVAQDCVLFDATVRDNVAYSVSPEPSEEDVWDALRQASASDFVEALPDKLYTHIGPGGIPMSGGQRQRLSIARALIRSPEILILDEATASLDPTNERVVQAAIEKVIRDNKVTVLIVAHRLTTVKNAAKIIVIDDGCIVEVGTHEELMQLPVEYAETQKGALKSGFYHSQWDSMMGKDAKEVDKTR